jgi:SM-20-related protein
MSSNEDPALGAQAADLATPSDEPSGPLLDLDALKAGEARDWPFRHMVAHRLLEPELQPGLEAAFPEIDKTGFFQADTLGYGPLFAQLVCDLKSPAFSQVVGEKLGVDLLNRPQMITIRKWSGPRDGRVHTDGLDKVATALLYLNPEWVGRAGALRYLTGPDLDAVGTPAIAPVFGAFTAFARSDGSWHGHPPFTGERRVVQIFWVKDQAAAERKTRRHGRQSLWRLLRGKVHAAA